VRLSNSSGGNPNSILMKHSNSYSGELPKHRLDKVYFGITYFTTLLPVFVASIVTLTYFLKPTSVHFIYSLWISSHGQQDFNYFLLFGILEFYSKFAFMVLLISEHAGYLYFMGSFFGTVLHELK